MTNIASATHSVIVERDLPHPPEKVWRALTQSALIEDWLMPNDFEPRVGHKFNFRATPMPQLERRGRLRSPDRRAAETAVL